MPTAQQAEAAPLPLTALSEEERMFQTTVRKFAREQIRPYVREMDEAGVFRKDIIRQFFEMGLMGIEIPEEYGGQGGTFLPGDAGGGGAFGGRSFGGRDRRRAEHHLQQRAAALGDAGAESEVPAAAGRRTRWRPTRCRKPGRGRTRSPWRRAPRTTATTSCSPAASCGSPTRPKAGFFLLFANANPEAGYKGVTAFLIEREFPGLPGRQEGGQARAARLLHLRADPGQLPRAARERDGRGRARATRSRSRR